MSDFLARGKLLCERERCKQALAWFQRALEESPHDSEALAWTAISLSHLKRHVEATDMARQAVAADPEDVFALYVLSLIFSAQNLHEEAELAIDQALELDAENPTLLGEAASIRIQRKKWKEAAELAELGLELDPTESLCLNARSVALNNLGRTADARDLLESSLSEDPENPVTLANLGWTALRSGDPSQALEFFQGALQRDPEYDCAREGLLEALRARYPFYRYFLRYLLWASGLTDSAQWSFLIGCYVIVQLVRVAYTVHPVLAPWLLPVVLLYILFVYMTWTAHPLTNLLLRLNPYGRVALSSEDLAESNLTAACVVGGAGAGIFGLLTWESSFFWLALVLFTLLLPVSSIYASSTGWPRWTIGGMTGLVAALGLLAVIAHAWGMDDLVRLLSTAYIVGFFVTHWAAGWLIQGRDRT